MNEIAKTIPEAGTLARTLDDARPLHETKRRGRVVVAVSIVAVMAIGGTLAWQRVGTQTPPPAAPPPPQVTVSQPLQRTVQPTARFLGQFSAVDRVELRAQVGGVLTEIDFRDGQVVHKGDPLFLIDPRPFQIKLDEAMAQLATAKARASLSQAELWRAQQLKQTNFGTAETVDQRDADLRSAQAAIETANAAIRDASLDLEFARITAPFTGRIGAHLVSVGSLVSGSRGGAGASTLMATIVSLDPVHLDFDMSESEYAAWQQGSRGAGPDADVAISVDGDGLFDRHGKLDFIDNVVDRGSGTIHARVTVPNPDLAITPGQFARLRVSLGHPSPALLVPAAAVVPDQSRHMVMTLAAGGTIVPKLVEIGGIEEGLRVIRSGLGPDDHVVIDGLVRARPGAKVTPAEGKIVPATDGDAS